MPAGFHRLQEHFLSPDPQAGVLVGREISRVSDTQGPVHAVMPEVAANHGPGFRSAGGNWRFSGCPESMRDKSGTGPLSVILSGVWQSLQPPKATRYLPRAI